MDDDSLDSPLPARTNAQEDGDAPAQVATPDDQNYDEAEAAAAAAEVATMARQTDARGRDPSADQAVMGALNDEGVAGIEAVDESGELVHQAFLQFLTE